MPPTDKHTDNGKLIFVDEDILPVDAEYFLYAVTVAGVFIVTAHGKENEEEDEILKDSHELNIGV